MNKTELIIIRISIAASLIMSIAALCHSLPCMAGLDYIGIIIGVLSLLVTVLIGWNIYALMDFNSKEKQINAIIEKITNEATKQMRHTTRAYVVYLSAMDSYSKGHMNIAIDGYFVAINEGLKGSDNDPITLSLSSLEDIAVYFTKHNGSAKIKPGYREKYTSTLYQLSKDKKFGDVNFERLFKMIEVAEIKGDE